jgi:hypothetical protein
MLVTPAAKVPLLLLLPLGGAAGPVVAELAHFQSAETTSAPAAMPAPRPSPLFTSTAGEPATIAAAQSADSVASSNDDLNASTVVGVLLLVGLVVLGFYLSY